MNAAKKAMNQSEDRTLKELTRAYNALREGIVSRTINPTHAPYIAPGTVNPIAGVALRCDCLHCIAKALPPLPLAPASKDDDGHD